MHGNTNPVHQKIREKYSLTNMHQHPTSGHYVDEEENE
jgi:hypothetical protein